MIVDKVGKHLVSTVLEGIFSSDAKFCNEFHAKAGYAISDIVEYDAVVFAQDNAEMFIAHEGEDVVGAFGYVYEKDECPNLSLFFVKPKYRHTAPIKEIWESVWEMNKSNRFFVGIRHKNKPATKFYERMGGMYMFSDQDPRNPAEQVGLYFFRRGDGN